MNRVTLEAAALRVAITLVRRTLRDVYLPGDDAFEPHQRDVGRVLELLDQLEIALLRLDIALDRDRIGSQPF
ncbi:hypothetical protein [Pendulispora albinea]|uniref:Uncharacterized protein n=1 Tax=Pendulispora albinea TaxID=2741071 RepID=A0ABZ2LWN0_9BACT